MDLQVQINRSSLKGQKRRRISVAACLLGLTALIIAVFTIQTNMSAATQPKQKNKAQGVVNIIPTNPTKLLPLENSKLEKIDRAKRNGTSKEEALEPNPTVIPPGITVNNVTFIGIDLTSSITAAADTNGDRVPDATENFIASDDPDNEATSSFVYSKKTGKFYTGVIAAGGPMKQQGFVIVADNNTTGTYKGIKKGSFSTGKGTPIALALLDTPKGDVLIVASLFFANELLGFTSADALSITAYLPDSSGVPDGTQKAVILGAGSKLGSNTINFSFGGMSLDSAGNLYVNAGIKVQNGGNVGLDGLILVFSDSDGDLIPDKGVVFDIADQADLNQITAGGIVAMPNPAGAGTRLAVFAVGAFANQPTQIVFYTDADGDFKADGPAQVFYTSTAAFEANFGSFGAGSSGIEVSHMDFADGQALFSFLALNAAQDTVIDSGVALVKDDGTGKGSAAVRVFQAPKTSGGDLGGITAVFGVPSNVDAVAPTVKVVAPNGGETVMGATQLAINFTSSDNKAVASHDISLSTDSGATFPIVVTSGLSGSVQTFSYVVPATIDSTNARIRVTAKDGAGNMASDDSDANFTIMKPTTADTQAPVVTISAPTQGASLNGGANVTVTFMSTDNVAVATHNIDFAADGVNFITKLATGLPGNATSFSFKVPLVSTTTGALRVQAVDASANVGTAIVSSLTVINDTKAPTVTVTSPKTKDKLKGGAMFNVTFTSSDDVGIASHEIQLSQDGGGTFAPLATGVAGNVQSFMVTIPNSKIKKGVIRVIARDAAGNMGMGNSGIFKVKPSK